MWAWIKAHKWLLIGLSAGAVILWYVLKNRAASSSSPADSSGAQLISGYGNPVVYSGGGVPMGSPSTVAGTPTTSPATNPANDPTPTPTSASHETLAPGITPSGPGWNQGSQPGATLGEGGTALPVASGDYQTAVPGQPGQFLNSQGYASQASYDSAREAFREFDIARDHGYIATGESASAQFAAGAFAPFQQFFNQPHTGGLGSPTFTQPVPISQGTTGPAASMPGPMLDTNPQSAPGSGVSMPGTMVNGLFGGNPVDTNFKSTY